MKRGNLLKALPDASRDEVFEILAQGQDVTIERITTQGQTSEQWYDQDRHEWVLLMQGQAKLCFSDGREITLTAGDHITLPAHCRHKVSWVDPEQTCVWLAVHYSANN